MVEHGPPHFKLDPDAVPHTTNGRWCQCPYCKDPLEGEATCECGLPISAVAAMTKAAHRAAHNRQLQEWAEA